MAMSEDEKTRVGYWCVYIGIFFVGTIIVLALLNTGAFEFFRDEPPIVWLAFAAIPIGIYFGFSFLGKILNKHYGS